MTLKNKRFPSDYHLPTFCSSGRFN